MVMLIDEPAIEVLLQRHVNALTTNDASRKDLLQEARIWLWKVEAGSPSKSQSWYIESCRLYLLNFQRAGRSIDSHKRREHCCQIPGGLEGDNPALEDLAPGADLFTQVCAREIVQQLLPRLKPRTGTILLLLDAGLNTVEIADKMGISHQMVSKLRRKIKATAKELGISRLF